MKWYKTLVPALLLPVFVACGGGEEGGLNKQHRYRVEVDFEGATSLYMIQVIISCVKDYVSYPPEFIDFTIDGGNSMEDYWDEEALTYHLIQADYYGHNFTFGNTHVFETTRKGVLLTVHITSHWMSDTDANDNPVSVLPMETKIRIYRDGKLVRETGGDAFGKTKSYEFGPEQY